jgi:hypothetical protein
MKDGRLSGGAVIGWNIWPSHEQPFKNRTAVDTAPKQRGVPFKPGQSGNPAGRPKGARSRLGEAFLSDLADAWADHGVEAIERVAKSDPGTFCKIVSNVLPKEVVQMAFSVNGNIAFADVEEAKAYLAAYRLVRDYVPTAHSGDDDHAFRRMATT